MQEIGRVADASDHPCERIDEDGSRTLGENERKAKKPGADDDVVRDERNAAKGESGQDEAGGKDGNLDFRATNLRHETFVLESKIQVHSKRKADELTW